jgi:fatty-acyl-CoA synthase
MGIASIADVRALERVPIATRIPARSTYEMMADVAARLADKRALRSLAEGLPDETPIDVTFGELLAQLTQAANLFHELGAGPDAAVSSLLPTGPQALVAMLGAHAAAVANPINYLLDVDHIAGLLREARARVLLVPDPDDVPGVWAKVAALRERVPTLAHVLRVGGNATRDEIDAPHFETELARRPTTLAFERTIEPGDVAALFHTGGTTSAPKLARHTHRGLIVQCISWAAMLGAVADDVVLNGLPPFHVGGAYCAGLAPLSCGATVVTLTPSGFRNRNVVAHFWALVERYRPTVLGIVPTAWSAVMTFPSDGLDLSSIRICNSGGAALPLELARSVGERTRVPVVEGWGMTETHGFASMNPASGECRIGSVGLRAPYTEMIVAAVEGERIARVAAVGEIGHVLVRGPQLFAGYVGAAAHAAGVWLEPLANETVPAWSAGGPWLDTGDLGRFDADGYLWVTGRAKDLIVRGGHNIDPLTIEHALQQHPEVEMAAAVGRPDAYAGELPMCFVQLKPNARVTGDELREFARERVHERAAAPVEVVVMPSLPLTGVGKIFKPELREIAARMTFERVVRALVDGSVDVAVTVEPHPVHGTLASIRLTGDVDATRLAELDRELDAFTLRHELTAAAR